VVLLLLGFVSAAVTFDMLRTDQLASAVFGSGVTCLSWAAGMWAIRSAAKLFSNALEEVTVCHTGLRWLRGGKRGLALWTELASVDLYESARGRGGLDNWSARITLKLRSGEELLLESDLLSDFVRLANAISGRQVQTIQEARRTSLDDAFRATPGPR
jgi:hypothetical protein